MCVKHRVASHFPVVVNYSLIMPLVIAIVFLFSSVQCNASAEEKIGAEYVKHKYLLARSKRFLIIVIMKGTTSSCH